MPKAQYRQRLLATEPKLLHHQQIDALGTICTTSKMLKTLDGTVLED